MAANTAADFRQILLSNHDVSLLMPDWPEQLVEDYLSFKRDLALAASTGDDTTDRVTDSEQDIIDNSGDIAQNAEDILSLEHRVHGDPRPAVYDALAGYAMGDFIVYPSVIDTQKYFRSIIPITSPAGTFNPDYWQEVTLQGNDANILSRLRFVRPYAVGPRYWANDVVNDNGWQMVANKLTIDRAGPVASGAETTALPDVPAWVEQTDTSSIACGHTYTFTEDGWVGGLRVWVPEVSASTTYNIVTLNVGTNETRTFANPLLIAGQWSVLALTNAFALIGDQLVVRIESLNSGGETTWAYNWEMQVSSNTTTPIDGAWNTNVQATLLRINWLDAEAVPVGHQIELQVIIDTVFEISEVGSPEKFVHYRVTAPYTEVFDHTEYTVTQVASANGGPTVGLPTQIRAVQPIPDPTKYVDILTHWVANEPTWATIVGFKEFDGVDQPGNDDTAFGVDISFTPAAISPDWDVFGTGGGAV